MKNPFKLRGPAFKPVAEPVKVETERVVNLDQIFQQLQLWNMEGGSGYFINLYIDQGGSFALYNDMGLLYRVPIDIAEDDTVTMGELEPVIQQFQSVNRTTLTFRQIDKDTVRFYMIAATAIINRSGEIDSTKLFDDFIHRAETTGVYPILDFYHMGEIDPAFEFGKFDFLGREGYVYIGSGLLDMQNPLALRMLKTWRAV